MVKRCSLFLRLSSRSMLMLLCVLQYETVCNEARKIKSFTANGKDFQTHIDQTIVFPSGADVILKCTVSGKWLPLPIYILDRDDRLLNGTSSLVDIVYTIRSISCSDRGPYYCITRDHKDERRVKMVSIDLDVADCPAQLCSNQTDHPTIQARLGHPANWIICIVGIISNPEFLKLRRQDHSLKKDFRSKKWDVALNKKYRSKLVHFIEIQIKTIQPNDTGLMTLIISTDTNSELFYTVNIQLSTSDETKYISQRFMVPTRSSNALRKNSVSTRPRHFNTSTTSVSNYVHTSTSIISVSNHLSVDQIVSLSTTGHGQEPENTGNEPTQLIINVALLVTLLMVIVVAVIYLVRRRIRRKRCQHHQEHHYSEINPIDSNRDDNIEGPPIPPRIPTTSQPTIAEPTSNPPPYTEVLIRDYIAQRQSVHPHELHFHQQDYNVGVYADANEEFTHDHHYNPQGINVGVNACDNEEFTHTSNEFCTTELKQFVSVNRLHRRTQTDVMEHDIIHKTGYSEKSGRSVLGFRHFNIELDCIEPIHRSVCD